MQLEHQNVIDKTGLVSDNKTIQADRCQNSRESLNNFLQAAEEFKNLVETVELNENRVDSVKKNNWWYDRLLQEGP